MLTPTSLSDYTEPSYFTEDAASASGSAGPAQLAAGGAGHIFLRSGAPLPNATVRVFLEDPADQPVSTAPLTVLGTVSSDAAGAFTFAMPAVTTAAVQAAVTAAADSNDGVINMLFYSEENCPLPATPVALPSLPIQNNLTPLSCAGDNEVGFSSVSLRVKASINGGPQTLGYTSPPAIMRMESVGSTSFLPGTTSVGTRTSSSNSPPNPYGDNCPGATSHRDSTTDEGNHYMTVGETHAYGPNMVASFSYSQSADSDSGTGASIEYGPFKASNTTHIGNTSDGTVSFQNTGTFGHQIASNFHFSLNQYTFTCEAISGETKEHVAVIQPDRWLGSATMISQDVSQYDGHAAFAKRTKYQDGIDPGFTDTKTHGSTISFEKAYDVSFSFRGATADFSDSSSTTYGTRVSEGVGVSQGAAGSYSVRGNSGYWNDKANNLIYADDEPPRS